MKSTMSLIALTFLFFGSCSKNKKVANEIEGTWKEVKANNVAVSDSIADKIIFEDCKHKKKENCKCTVVDGQGGDDIEYYYSIDDKGKTIVLEIPVGFLTANTTIDILELEGDKLIFKWASYTGEYIRL